MPIAMLSVVSAIPPRYSAAQPQKPKRAMSDSEQQELAKEAVTNKKLAAVFDDLEPEPETNASKRRAVSYGRTIVATPIEVAQADSLQYVSYSLPNIATATVVNSTTIRILVVGSDSVKRSVVVSSAAGAFASGLPDKEAGGYKLLDSFSANSTALVELLTELDHFHFPLAMAGKAAVNAAGMPDGATRLEYKAADGTYQVHSDTVDVPAARTSINRLVPSHRSWKITDSAGMSLHGEKADGASIDLIRTKTVKSGGEFYVMDKGWFPGVDVFHVVCGRPQLMAYKTAKLKGPDYAFDGAPVSAETEFDADTVKLCCQMRTALITEKACSGVGLLYDLFELKSIPRKMYSEAADVADGDKANNNGLFLSTPVVDALMEAVEADLGISIKELLKSIVWRLGVDANGSTFGSSRAKDTPAPEFIPAVSDFKSKFTEDVQLDNTSSSIAGLVADGTSTVGPYTTNPGNLATLETGGAYFEKTATVCTSYTKAIVGGLGTGVNWSFEIAERAVYWLNKRVREVLANAGTDAILRKAWTDAAGQKGYSMKKYWRYCTASDPDQNDDEAFAEFMNWWEHNIMGMEFVRWPSLMYERFAPPQWGEATQHWKVALAFASKPGKSHAALIRNEYLKRKAQTAAEAAALEAAEEIATDLDAAIAQVEANFKKETTDLVKELGEFSAALAKAVPLLKVDTTERARHDALVEQKAAASKKGKKQFNKLIANFVKSMAGRQPQLKSAIASAEAAARVLRDRNEVVDQFALKTGGDGTAEYPGLYKPEFGITHDYVVDLFRDKVGAFSWGIEKGKLDYDGHFLMHSAFMNFESFDESPDNRLDTDEILQKLEEATTAAATVEGGGDDAAEEVTVEELEGEEGEGEDGGKGPETGPLDI